MAASVHQPGDGLEREESGGELEIRQSGAASTERYGAEPVLPRRDRSSGGRTSAGHHDKRQEE